MRIILHCYNQERKIQSIKTCLFSPPEAGIPCVTIVVGPQSLSHSSEFLLLTVSVFVQGAGDGMSLANVHSLHVFPQLVFHFLQEHTHVHDMRFAFHCVQHTCGTRLWWCARMRHDGDSTGAPFSLCNRTKTLKILFANTYTLQLLIN